VADSWFLSESVGQRPRLELERAAVAAALLECLDAWEEQVIRFPHGAAHDPARAHPTLAFSQLRACVALMRGLECLDAALMSPTN
jgi:hypothetical protein